ncbi:MAG: hypothetical protein K2X81_24055 [Candidatus Obscuribacterales bacterium]|jgi:hypothetical protein|nr:hypothetical protein [Candidatus Obscuribacterales bacterium]
MESEQEIINFIQSGQLRVGPVLFDVVQQPASRADNQPSLIVNGNWGENQMLFAAEVKRYGSDKSVMQAANNAQYYADCLNMNPLVVVPWLSEDQLLSLEKRRISGVDLCGNGILVAPGLSVFRTGSRNKFPASRPLKRVYDGTSALVARVFLLKPEYKSVSEIREEVLARGGNITLSTVSKVLKQLEEDVVVSKSKDGIRLLQADKLLNRLRTNYKAPKTTNIIRSKINTAGEVPKLLTKAAKQANFKLVLSGTSSVDYYATMGREPLDTYFCTINPLEQLEGLGAMIDTASRFPNVEFQVTNEEYVYFDARKDKSGRLFASPIQTYLELATSDKRGQEIAQQVERDLLADLPTVQRSCSA